MSQVRLFPVAILTIFVGTALAHEGMHGPGAEYDADEDGELSVAEYTAYLKSSRQDVAGAAGKFAKLDKDKNGFLSSSEFILGMPKTPAATKSE
jgi:hypothetical protein